MQKSLITKNDHWSHISDHLRLYMDYIHHEITSISTLQQLQSVEYVSQLDVSLDHLLTLSAYSLIDRHRQSFKISLLEDQSLRRCALLMLIVQHEGTLNLTKSKLIEMLLLLIISKNAYHIGQEGMSVSDESDKQECRSFVLDMEFNMINRLVRGCLARELKNWIINLDNEVDPKVDDTGKTVMDKNQILLTLRLVKMIINHHKQRPSIISDRVLNLKANIQSTLRHLIAVHFKKRLRDLIESLEDENRRTAVSRKDSWNRVLHDVQLMNNDLKLFWSKRGLDGLMRQSTFEVTSSRFTTDQSDSLSKLIERKLNVYLKK